MCSPGTASSAGATSCDPCPAGSASTASGSTACDECKAGEFSATPGSIACTDCRTSRENGEGYWSSVGAASCDVCDRHFYQEAAKCKPCPPGARCVEVGTTPTTLEVKPGWFRFEEASVKLYECSDGGKAAW